MDPNTIKINNTGGINVEDTFIQNSLSKPFLFGIAGAEFLINIA